MRRITCEPLGNPAMTHESADFFAHDGLRFRTFEAGRGTPIVFVHPKNMGGVLVELMETPHGDH